MERKCLHTSFKYQKVNTRPIFVAAATGGEESANDRLRTLKKKVEEDYINGLIWPPRSYTCNFCEREFKSAQALGGHMNVHRRDRAMLRQYSPPIDGQYTNLNLNLQPNPNPNSPSSYSANNSFAETKKWGGDVNDIASYDPFDLRPSDFKKPVMEIKKPPSLFEDFAACYGDWNKSEKLIRLDMEITSVLAHDSKKDIDLELRLGFSS